MTSHPQPNKAHPPLSDKSAQRSAPGHFRVDPQDAILRCLVLTEAAEFTLELLDILRELAPLAAKALEQTSPGSRPALAQLALHKATQILEEMADEEAAP